MTTPNDTPPVVNLPLHAVSESTRGTEELASDSVLSFPFPPLSDGLPGFGLTDPYSDDAIKVCNISNYCT